jgi:hypothetical protein
MTRALYEVVGLDRRWFRAHPERRHRCRWPDKGELDLFRSDRDARLVMAIRHLGRGHVVYQPVIFQGAGPADEESAAALFALAARHPEPIPFIAEMDVLWLTSPSIGTRGDAAADVASMLLLITLARHLDRFQAALGGEPITADRVRALAPDLWRAVDRDAAGLLDTIMGAVRGDGAAINRLLDRSRRATPPPRPELGEDPRSMFLVRPHGRDPFRTHWGLRELTADLG